MEVHPRWIENLILVAWFMFGTFLTFVVIALVKRWWQKKTGSKPSLRDRLVQRGIYPTIKDDEIRKELKENDNNS